MNFDQRRITGPLPSKITEPEGAYLGNGYSLVRGSYLKSATLG